MNPTKSEPLWTTNFVLLTAAATLFYLVMFGLTPTLTLFAQTLGGGPAVGGLIVMAVTLGQVLPRVLFGNWADSWGRKPVFLLGIAIIALVSPCFGLVLSVAAVMGLRFLQGVGFSAASTGGNTLAADLVPAARRAEGIGYYSLSNTIGMALGPGLGLYFYEAYGPWGLFLAATAGGLLGVAIGALVGRNSNTSTVPAAAVTQTFTLEKSVLPVCLVLFFLVLPYGAVLGYVASFGAERGVHNIGLYFSAMAAAVLLVRLTTGRLSDRHGIAVVLVPALLLMAAGLGVLFWADGLGVFLVSAVLFGLGFGSVYPLLQTAAMALSPEHRRGASNALLLATMDIGIGLGALVTGIGIAAFGYSLAFSCTAGFVGLGLVSFWVGLAGKLRR